VWPKKHIGFVVVAVLGAIPGLAAQPARTPQGPDPVLRGPTPPAACGAALDGADYVPGLDANGQPVPRADIGAERVPVPGEILMPLPNRTAGGRGGRGPGPGTGEAPYVSLDGRRLESLLNPEPPCQSGTR
jgi:hypothetical protein